MKQLYTTLFAIIAIVHFSYGQNTSPWPSSGNIGIGINTGLNAPLTVQGGGVSTGLANIGTTLTTKFNTANPPITLGIGYVSSDNPFLQAFNSSIGSANSLIINPFGGNVGIGTTTPSKLLTLSTFGSGSTVSSLLRLEQYNAGSPISGTGVAIDMAIGDNYNSPGVSGQIRTVRSNYSNSSMYFATSLSNTLTDRMLIDPNGNVGIGTLSPDAKLAVKGTIHTQEVKVDLNVPGPDYVFNDDYKLTTLTEVKDYITKNHHLPEIPSAAQMEKEGINLGDMNTKLLKKVEELTLYAIDQQKQIEQLKQEQQKSKEQETRIATLEAALTKLTSK